MPQPSRRLVVLAFLVALSFILVASHTSSSLLHAKSTWKPVRFMDTLLGHRAYGRHAAVAGNATLGFQAILALSRGTKWRVDGLRMASMASNIILNVPPQPKWSDPFIRAFEEFGPVEAHGAAMAWLGHIDLIKLVIMNGWGSALIMEDDMDWDVDIRSQMPRIARAVNRLTNGTSQRDAPYGLEWDIMWLGHCSDPPPDQRDEVVIFKDPTTIDIEIYRGLNPHVKTILPTGQRMVHFSVNPVCTFAYAVSAIGAPKLLAYASLGKGGAYDLMLMHACQDKVLKCVSVNPEIFHPYQPVGSGTSEVRAGDAGQAMKADIKEKMGWTENVLNSARCKGQYNQRCPWFPGIEEKTDLELAEDAKTRGKEASSQGQESTAATVGTHPPAQASPLPDAHTQHDIHSPDGGQSSQDSPPPRKDVHLPKQTHSSQGSHSTHDMHSVEELHSTQDLQAPDGEQAATIPLDEIHSRPIKTDTREAKGSTSIPTTGESPDGPSDSMPPDWADS